MFSRWLKLFPNAPCFMHLKLIHLIFKRPLVLFFKFWFCILKHESFQLRSKTPTNLWVARSGEVLVSYSGYVCSLCDSSLSKEEKLGGVGRTK